jgi:hypothetical protein
MRIGDLSGGDLKNGGKKTHLLYQYMLNYCLMYISEYLYWSSFWAL